MPFKHAYLRYQILDRCFRDRGKKYFLKDLIIECNQSIREFDPNSEGIALRQIYMDISYMESKEGWSAPIEHLKDGRKVYFRYSDLNFSINNQLPNKLELDFIKNSMLVFEKLSGLPQFEWLIEFVAKLEQMFLDTEEDLIGFDTNPYLPGLGYLNLLFTSIVYKQVLRLTYKPYVQDEEISFVHPYYLKKYNNRWFLFGYNEKNLKVSIFALDRILSIQSVNKSFIENESINFKEYFEDIIGVSRPKNNVLTEITLHFSSEQAPYIMTKPLHDSQKKKVLNENGLIITIEVIPNYELDMLIMSYGETVEVLAPEGVRKSISDKLKKACAKY